MLFGELFRRDIGRFIDGVIKPDATDHLRDELDEYVLTPEIRRGLNQFCDEYNNRHSEGNGAWISGFYGSGKSHLLKMISYMLENPVIPTDDPTHEGWRAFDYVKPHISDATLVDNLILACERTPSESILFDISAKADLAGRMGDDALLSAFVKVFNEKCGYFGGTQAFVAAFERDLDRDGLYNRFKEEFEKEDGNAWEDVRAKALSKGFKASRAYDRVYGNPEGTNKNIIGVYQKEYHPSYEDFATWVAEYVERRQADTPGFRLNFFVDEVGQFIANNDTLMLGLQQIMQLLNTKCGRRVWVVVVSQETVDDLVGVLTQRSAQDFSKIMARFKVRINIPSTDANAVVKDRLLGKKDSVLPALDRLYDRYSGDFKVLFDFPDGAKRYAIYQDEDEFEQTYPLVPYQFPLFHAALETLSGAGAFTGEFTSTGARNMLSATRNVLKERRDKGDVGRGDLVSFDEMFDGLRGDLKSSFYHQVMEAQTSLDPGEVDRELAVRIMKCLLLVKYNKEFEATPKNLCVLLYGSFSENAETLQQRIHETLLRLASEHYIRDAGDGAFEYLTDKEKEIEREIGNVRVDPGEVRREIGGLFKSDIITATRVQYTNQGFRGTYNYDVMVDGQAIGSHTASLTLNIITALTVNETERMPSFSKNKELLCILPLDNEFINEMHAYLQTQRYLGTNLGKDPNADLILSVKQDINKKRWTNLISRFEELLQRATWGTRGDDVTKSVTGTSAAGCVTSALNILVARSYEHLRMLTENYTQNSIYTAATKKLGAGTPMPEYCTETLTVINQILGLADTCTVGGSGSGSLESFLGGGDHGWPPYAVYQAVGILAANSRVECTRNDDPVEGNDLADQLAKRTKLDSLYVRPVKSASAATISALQEAYKKVSGQTASSDDARVLANGILEAAQQKAGNYAKSLSSVRTMPFADTYDALLADLQQLANHKRDWFISSAQTLPNRFDDLLKPLQEMSSFATEPATVKIYQDASEVLGTLLDDASCTPGGSGKLDELRELMADEKCYESDSPRLIKRLTREIKRAIDETLKAEREQAQAGIETFVKGIFDQYYGEATDENRSRAQGLVEYAVADVANQQHIRAVRSAVDDFKAQYAQQLIALGAKPEPTPVEPVGGGGQTPPPPGPAPTKTVSYTQVCKPTGYYAATLSTEDDVDSFVEALRIDLKKRIQNDEIIYL